VSETVEVIVYEVIRPDGTVLYQLVVPSGRPAHAA
jgi:hypothetical protein